MREKIAKWLYNNFNTRSRGVWEELPKFNEVRQWWLSKADEIDKQYSEEIEKARKQNPYLDDGDLCDYCFGFDLACQKILAMVKRRENERD